MAEHTVLPYRKPPVHWKDKLRKMFAINTKLLPLKFLLLLMFGGMSALYPFMTIHMKSIGLSLMEIGLIYAVLPFVSFIGPPLGGALADRIGNYRLVFIGFTLYCVVSHMALWFAVPSSMPKKITTTDQVSNMQIRFSCQALPANLIDFDGSVLNQTCSIKQTIPELRFTHCSTTCKNSRPEICFYGSSFPDCSVYSDLDNRYLTNVSIQMRNESFALLNFTSEEHQPVVSVACRAAESNCFVSCGMTTNVLVTCEKLVPSGNHVQTVALYATLRFLAGIGMSTVSPILDAIAYQMSKEHHGDLGFQRMFTLIGMCASPPLSGFLVGVASKSSGYEDFSPAFYLFGCMFTISAVIAYFMSLQIKLPAEHIWKNMRRILYNPKVSMFVLMMFFTGAIYLFIFMEQLGSPKWLLGMTNTVSAISALPVVAASTIIMKYLGHTKIVMLCCILYGCRFLAYSFIYNPYHVLPIEILEAFTTSLLWVVASVYCGKLAPDYLATLQGVVGGAHAAIGRGLGSLIGGVMFEHLKPRRTYQIFAAACIYIGVFYGFLHFIWLKRLGHPAAVRNDEMQPKEIQLTEQEEKELEETAESEALVQTFGDLRPFSHYSPVPQENQQNTNGISLRPVAHKYDL